MFLVAASVYVLSVLMIHALAPRLEPVALKRESPGVSLDE
jgi:hypothetical protein